ncbi:MAG: YbaN family protein [Polyangiaceae bacterium]|nr:YbaN family protein [Polyangiaceae bacterium]
MVPRGWGWDSVRVRVAWVVLGLGLTALGFLGLALPLLPGTPFFLAAAWAFARSSPRLYRWLLGLPRVGPAIRDYRDGLGVARRTKLVAVTLASVAVGLSATFATSVALQISVVFAGVLGVAFVLWRVPTREVVLAQQHEGARR